MSALDQSRRHFLRATGVTLALPMLESFAAPAAADEPRAKRLVCIGAYLGFYRPEFYPKQTGKDYELTTLLKPVEALRDDFTVFSGFDHRAKNGHDAWDNFLCGQRKADVSLDQIVADEIGGQTRFSSMQVTAGESYRNMSYTKHGVALPMIQRPSVFYNKLFASPYDRKRTEYLLESGQSAVDKVLDEAKRLQQRVSTRDREKLEEYFTSVREVEQRMQKHRAGIDQPIPEVDYQLPDYDPIAPTQMLEAEEIFYDLMALALETDSTRVLTMFLTGAGQVFTLDGETLRAGYHALSHHGNDPDKIRDLVRVELEHMNLLAKFLGQLKTKTDAEGRPLLDSTIVLTGTGMGDASRHSNRDLPTLVAGGGFDHGQHIAANGEHLLGDVYLTLLQQMGIEAEAFSNAKQNLNHQFS
ncbi:MAG: hypothetical protein ACI8UO_006521 [Verrucomicrobiales bacterium]|jgi:hypothetical protein